MLQITLSSTEVTWASEERKIPANVQIDPALKVEQITQDRTPFCNAQLNQSTLLLGHMCDSVMINDGN